MHEIYFSIGLNPIVARVVRCEATIGPTQKEINISQVIPEIKRNKYIS
jgi:hypothetical protein